MPEWIRVIEVQNQGKIQELEAVLDKGEASAIALALETEKSQLIIDEKKGREVAQKLKIEIIGTLKVILMAKQKGIIQSARPVGRTPISNTIRSREILSEIWLQTS